MPENNNFLIANRYCISPMIESDIDIVMKLENEAFTIPWTKESIQGQMNAEFSRIWTLFDKAASPEKLIGFISYWIVGDAIDLHQICISREDRRSGLGMLLMKFLIAIAKRQNIAKIHLEVRKNNIPAISLYRQCGFLETGVRPKYYNDTGEDAILMNLDIEEQKG